MNTGPEFGNLVEKKLLHPGKKPLKQEAVQFDAMSSLTGQTELIVV